MDDDENNTYVIRPHFEDKYVNILAREGLFLTQILCLGRRWSSALASDSHVADHCPYFRFRPDKVREIIHSVLQDYFCDKKYDSAAALNWR